MSSIELHRIESRIELIRPRLRRQKERRWDEDENPIGGNDGHALQLRADETAASPVCRRKARAAGCGERRNE